MAVRSPVKQVGERTAGDGAPPPARDPLSHRLVPLWTLLGGLVVGAGWGGLARLWMRSITTSDPEFSWAGTLFILGIFAVVGMTAGLVLGARRRRWRGGAPATARIVGCAATLVLSIGQGALFAPTLLFGGLAMARRSWPPWLRAALALLAVVPVAIVHLDLRDGWPHSSARLLGAAVLGLVVYGGAAAALAQSYAPMSGARLPRSARWLLLAVPVSGLTVLGVPNAVDPATLRPTLAVVSAAIIATWLWRVRSSASQRATRSPLGERAGAHGSTAQMTCNVCGEVLDARSVRAVAGPGATGGPTVLPR
jgi:hypothetical protein